MLSDEVLVFGCCRVCKIVVDVYLISSISLLEEAEAKRQVTFPISLQ